MLIDEYKDLVPTENFTKPKFMSYLDAILNPIIQMGSVIETIGYSFDINNASGAQLDIIGELVGLRRLSANEIATPLIIDGQSYYTREMTDEEYRIAIKMKIARNEWDGTNEDAVERYSEVFGSTGAIAFVDNQDCTMNIFVYDVLTLRETEILEKFGCFLVPAGVYANIYFVGDETTTEIKNAAAVSGILYMEKVTAS